MLDRVNLFGIAIDPLTLDEAVDTIYGWFDEEKVACRFVVTPNVDHVVMLQRNKELQESYRQAGLVLADGKPVVAASKLLKRPLPQVVPGSDLVPGLLAAASSKRPIRVFLLGAGPGIAEKASNKIRQRWPEADPVGSYCPPIGFEHDPDENERIIDMINQHQPDLLVIGLGAPKQELWITKHRDRIEARVAICAGATIDFLAENKQRAPRWLRALSLEWMHRMLTEPKRLVPRYAKDAWYFPQIFFRQLITK